VRVTASGNSCFNRSILSRKHPANRAPDHAISLLPETGKLGKLGSTLAALIRRERKNCRENEQQLQHCSLKEASRLGAPTSLPAVEGKCVYIWDTP
jgi:hypothetical protein